MIQGIDVVFIHAKDPEKLSKWYKEILELDISFSTPDQSWQEFKMEPSKEVTRFALDFPGENPSGLGKQSIIISFKVEDLLQSIAKLESKGITFPGTPTIMDTGKTLFSTLQDPEGNWIQLSQRKV
jgi:hypothetical protein